MKGLYKFFWDCGRMGDVEGLFIATSEDVEDSIGKNIYFGEILGKHSEISGKLGSEDLTLLSCDVDKLNWLEGIAGKNISGFNPLEYIDEYEEDEND